MARKRLPDPEYTPPTPMEEQLGYAFACPQCGRTWAKRFYDHRTRCCLPCARAWRRDDMASRRRGLGGVPLGGSPPVHNFESQVLRRTIDLNSDDARRAAESNPEFQVEVDRYVSSTISSNTGRTPIRGGILTMIRQSRPRVPAPVPSTLIRTPVATITAVPPEVAQEIDELTGSVIDVDPTE